MRWKICGWPGCSRLATDNYYCAEHRAISNVRRKDTAFSAASHHSEVYRTSEWRKFRQKIIRMRGCCAQCGSREGKLHVHHIVPVRDRPDLFLSEDNCVVLCESCHAVETQREIASRRNR